MNIIIKKISAMLAVSSVFGLLSAYAMDSTEFDAGMKKGILYYNSGLYYEAKDEFQWFCDFNWGRMNENQQSAALKYLDNTKQKIANLAHMDSAEFDAGMKKGILYYNSGLYYEAKDEFQWFCDFNWGRMNENQQSVALKYLDNTKQKIANLTSGNSYNTYNGKFCDDAYIGKWFVSLSKTTSSSLVFSIEQGESSYYADNVLLKRQANGSYTGSAYTEWGGMSYYTVWIENKNRISVTVSGSADATGTRTLYRK